MADQLGPDKLPQLRRVIPLELTAIPKAAPAKRDDGTDTNDDPDGDRFDMSFSSEAPVQRWFGDEILDHSASAIDLSRASRGMAYLVDHDTGDNVGLIESLRVEKNKLRGIVRFSRSQRAQDIKRDVQDGIRPFTSIGYRVNELVLEKETKDDDGTHRVYRVTNWTPMEGSTVAVPADTSVGAGRAAAGSEEFALKIRSAIPTTKEAPLPGARSEVRTMATSPVVLTPKDSAEILRLCDTHKVDRKRAIELIEKEGMTVDQASREILAEVAKRDGKTLQTPAAEKTDSLVLTDREQRQYNMCRGIMTHVRNIEENRHDTSFEMEVSEEISKKHEGRNHGGLFVPWRLNIDQQAARNAIERASSHCIAISASRWRMT